jgi:hypothetical protein
MSLYTERCGNVDHILCVAFHAYLRLPDYEKKKMHAIWHTLSFATLRNSSQLCCRAFIEKFETEKLRPENI